MLPPGNGFALHTSHKLIIQPKLAYVLIIIYRCTKFFIQSEFKKTMNASLEEVPSSYNLICHVCSEKRFEERDGFYYCQECGTKQEQVRLVEIERDFDIDGNKSKTTKQKIRVAKSEKPQLTSWECYNYILRGLVEELMSYGAKEELKLMALQVWAAYLRRMEVAFFNRKQPDLPKLGIIYLKNDAQIVYNHSKQIRKKPRRSDATSVTSGDENNSRNWVKRKRKLDESNYSIATTTSAASGLTSSLSANSNRAIKLDFNSKARAYFKKKMPVTHLNKHQCDAEGLLTCHKQPTAREINRSDYQLMSINIKQIYSILAISLNLISDNIQLCDLVRFIHEGHITTSNVLKYFPENIANDGKEMLKKINFYKYPQKYSDKALRDHIGLLCKNIGIRVLKTPDIMKLIERYTTELCLPKALVDYIGRLINLMPPNFKTRSVGQYPGFEARAMAYIIFALKLFFGLDDSKEHVMSRYAKKLNSKIEQLNRNRCEKQPLLFVWNEWVEYIEMRKVIVSQSNTSVCEQFQQCQSSNQVIQQMTEELIRTEEANNLLNNTNKNLDFTQKLNNLKSIFESFQESYKLDKNYNKPPVKIEFKPSLTPSVSYLENILLLLDGETIGNSSINIEVPDFMYMDHSQRDINSYLQVKPLIKYFKKHQMKLNVHVLATTENKEYVGIFRAPRQTANILLYKAQCDDVTEEEWSKDLKPGCTERTDDLEFSTDVKTVSEYVIRKSKPKEFVLPDMNYDLTTIQDDAYEVTNKNMREKNLPHNNFRHAISNEDHHFKHSFELFSENNMDPFNEKGLITRPRRNLEDIDLFKDVSDEEYLFNSDDGNISDDSEPEELIKEEQVPSTRSQRQPKKGHKISTNHNNNVLKMYISNMDCWMILGNLSSTSKAQKKQLQDRFPHSFNWLLETCSQTINVEWSAVFVQLLCIETMLCLGINDINTIKSCVYLNSYNSNKDMQFIINSFREIW